MTNTAPTNNTPTDATAAFAETIDRYLAAYCEPDAARRATMVADAWSDGGSLFDPPFEGTGHEALCDLTDVVLHHYPAHTFRRTTTVDLHHDRGRYGWVLVDPSGTAAVTGTDFARFDPEGKLMEIVGFFGDPVAQS